MDSETSQMGRVLIGLSMLCMVSDTLMGVLSWSRKTRLVIEDLGWSAAKADLQQSGDRPVRTGPLLTPVGVSCSHTSSAVILPAIWSAFRRSLLACPARRLRKDTGHPELCQAARLNPALFTLKNRLRRERKPRFFPTVSLSATASDHAL